MKKYKKLIIIIIIFSLIITISTILYLRFIPIKLNTILKNNDYELVDVKKPTTENDEYLFKWERYEYLKDNIAVFVYKFNNLQEVKEDIYVDYNQFKDNPRNEIIYYDEENYIYVSACDELNCHYYLGYDTNLVSSFVDTKDKEKTDKIYNEILKGRKFK